MAQHQTGATGGYTAPRRPVTLVWSETFPTRDEAFAAERRIKGWSRAKKEALIAGDWDRLRMLARNRDTFDPDAVCRANPALRAPIDKLGTSGISRVW